MYQALTTFDKQLLVIQTSEDVRIGLYFAKHMQENSETMAGIFFQCYILIQFLLFLHRELNNCVYILSAMQQEENSDETR